MEFARSEGLKERWGSLRRIEAAMEPKGWLAGLIHRARSRYFRYTSDRIGAANVEWGQQRNWKVVDPTVLIPGILSKIRPRNCPNQSYVRCITDSAPRQASVAESSVALPPVSVESRHAVSHALNPRLLAASTGQHAGPKCMRTGVEDDQLGTRNYRLDAHSIRLVADDRRRHHDLLFSDSAPAR